MGIPRVPSHLTLSTLKRTSQGHSNLEVLYLLRSPVRLYIAIFLLNIDRKPYMGSPMAPSHYTLSDTERLSSRSLRFQIFYLVKKTS